MRAPTAVLAAVAAYGRPRPDSARATDLRGLFAFAAADDGVTAIGVFKIVEFYLRNFAHFDVMTV
jgi:hypothetical protein